MGEIKSGTFLGSVNLGGYIADVEAIGFPGDSNLYAGQKVTKNGKTGHILRSRNFVLSTAHSFSQANGITDEALSVIIESASTDTGGYLVGTFTPPAGYAIENGNTEGWFVYKVDQESSEEGGAVSSVRSAFTQVTDWAKANPVLAAAVALGIGYLVHLYMYRNKKKKPKYLGLV